MKRSIILLLVVVALLPACNPSSEDNTKPIESPDTLENKVVQQSDTLQGTIPTKAIPTIIGFIDSLYGYEEPQGMDTLSNWIVSNTNIKRELGPQGLDLTELETYYRYARFHFLVFKDRSTAKKQFDTVVEAGLMEGPRPSNSGQRFFTTIFQKSGSVYILYGNQIIYHHRRCSFNEEIEAPKEDELLRYLFDSQLPATPYFVRVKCGWTQQEVR